MYIIRHTRYTSDSHFINLESTITSYISDAESFEVKTSFRWMLPAAKSDHDSTITSRQQYHRYSLPDFILSESSITGENCLFTQKENITIISIKNIRNCLLIYIHMHVIYLLLSFCDCSWNMEWNLNSWFLRLKWIPLKVVCTADRSWTRYDICI